MVKKRRLSSIFLSLAARQNLSDWAQSLAVIAIGGIAITLFCGFLANSGSLSSRVESMIQSSNAPDIYVTTDPRKQADPADSVNLVSYVENIEAIESRFYSFATLSSHNAISVISPTIGPMSKPYEIVETAPEHSDTHYFIIDDALAHPNAKASDTTAIPVGSEVKMSFDLSSFTLNETMLEVLDGFIKEGKENPFRNGKIELTFTVTASMKHIEDAARGAFSPTMFLTSSSYFRDAMRSSLSNAFTDAAVRLIWQVGFHDILGWGDGDPYGESANFPSPNQYLLRLKAGSDLEKTKTQIKAYFEAKETNNLYLCQTLSETASVNAVNTEVSQAVQLTYVFPLVFFAVALLVILISVRQMILRERTEIGTYKALGITPKEIHRHYFLKTALLVGLGTLIGEILGPLIVPAIMGNKYNLLYSLPARTFYFPWLPGIGAAVVFIGVALLVTFGISRREIKRKPVESMRPLPPSQKEKKIRNFKEKHLWQLSLKMAGRSIRADWVKTGMVIVGVLGCTALLICGFGIEDTINYGVNTDPLIVSGADVTLFMIESRDENKFKTDFDIKDSDGQPMFYGYQPYQRDSTNIVSENASYFGTVHVLGDYHLVAGDTPKSHFHYDFPLDEALITEKVARALKINVGDKIRFNAGKGDATFKVSTIIPVFYDNGVFIHADAPSLTGSVTSYNAVWMDAMPGKESKALDVGKNLPGVGLCDSEASWRERVKDAMSSVLVMTNAIKVFAFLLAIVVLNDLSLLNFKERSREIATMKVLGFKEMEIMVSLLVETMSLSTIGIIGGLLVGYPFTRLVLFINQVDLVDFLYTVAPATYGIAFGFTFILSAVITLLLAFRIRHIKAVESLKSVE